MNWAAGCCGAFALVCSAWAWSSNVASAGPSGESARMATLTVQGATPSSPLFSRSFDVTFEKKQRFVATWIYYRSTCKSAGVGSFETIEDAVHGALAFSTIRLKIPAGFDCAGTTLPASAVHYTWTDAEENDGEDAFHVVYHPPAGSNLSPEDMYGTTKLLAKPELFIVSPTLLVPNLPNRLTLSSVLAADPTRPSVVAEKLVGDGTATAIVLVRSKAPVAAKLTIDEVFDLAPYFASFPSTPPRKGMAELILSKKDFVRRGAFYYAAGLLQSPPNQPAIHYGFADPDVKVTQAGEVAEDSIGLVPTPVVLLHGLWGDATSLATTRNYLQKTDIFRNHSTSLLLVEYPPDLSFDSAPTLAAVRDAVARQLQALDDDHVVGGRVDVIAHSMGGLVTRSYTATASYKAPANRGAGVFRQVITVDTPHLGSELATYLVDHRADTRIGDGTLTWRLACGSDATTTVEECFSDNDMPIAGGAVESLKPGSAALARAKPLSTVRNLRWTAFTSYITSTGLRTVLDSLIEATNADEGVSTDSILGGVRNDVVVTVPSQRGGATRVVSLVGLAHSKLLSGLQSGPSVLTSPKVDATIACILRDPANQRCLRGVSPSPPAVAAAADPERIVAGEPPEIAAGAVLGRPHGIAVGTQGPRVVRVLVAQKAKGARTPVEDEVPFRVVAGRVLATFLPQVLGAADLTVGVEHADGTLDVHRGVVDVAFATDALASFVPDRVDTTLVLFPGSRHPLRAIGRLATDGRDVDVTPAAHYEVVSDPDGSVRLEAGVLHGVRPGRALVRAQVGALVRDLVVLVKPD